MRICFVLLGIICYYTSFSQENLVRYAEVRFTSPFEKKVLDDYFLAKKSDLFMLFMANGALLPEASIVQSKERFLAHLKAYQNEKFKSKKNDKKAKLIYDDIHSAFLQKYEGKNSFENIFYNGYYNSVSASALYGLAFDQMNIPFVIKEDPTNVYLIAYPETDRIMIETKNPLVGFYTMDQTFKQNYVKMLKDQKQISAKEFAAADVNALFDKYYFAHQQDITLINLVGIQYQNDAIFMMEENRNEDAFAQLEKAYLFNPSDRCGYLLTVAATAAFETRKTKDSVHANYLSKLSRYKNYGITSDMIQGEFSRIIQELLYTEGKKKELDLYYKQLDHGITDFETKKEITFLYNYECGRSLYTQARFKESLPYFNEAIKVKPNHADTKTALIGALSQTYRGSGSNLELLKELEKYADQYPSLQENNLFNSMFASSMAVQFNQEFNLGKPIEGEKYKKQFEEHAGKFSDLILDNNLIGQAYSSAAVYYFRKGQKAKAQSILTKGLEYAPNNYELLRRQKVISGN
jgi:tetratricopeptide (TPR) repeat protein